jgi:fructose-bisphosphate aldolase class I
MAVMANEKMMSQMSSKPGFIAALDQSGGSTPGALRLYGIPESEYKGDDAFLHGRQGHSRDPV